MNKPKRVTEVAVRLDRLPSDLRRVVAMQLRELIHEYDDAIYANNLDFSPAQFEGTWANLHKSNLHNNIRKVS
jgi:hypothetical protein